MSGRREMPGAMSRRQFDRLDKSVWKQARADEAEKAYYRWKASQERKAMKPAPSKLVHVFTPPVFAEPAPKAAPTAMHAKLWCEQCERNVAAVEAGQCGAPFCKARSAQA